MANGTTHRYQDIGALEQRVYNVEQGLQSISQQLGVLSSKIDERSRTPWATMIAGGVFMMSLMTTVGVLAYRPIDQSLVRQEADIRDFKRETAADFRVVRDQIVPRGEHTEKWTANRQELASLQRQIDDLVRRSGDVYSARDVILDLKQRIERFETRANGK